MSTEAARSRPAGGYRPHPPNDQARREATAAALREEIAELREEARQMRSLLAGIGAVLLELAPTCDDDEQAGGL